MVAHPTLDTIIKTAIIAIYVGIDPTLFSSMKSLLFAAKAHAISANKCVATNIAIVDVIYYSSLSSFSTANSFLKSCSSFDARDGSFIAK